MEHVTLRQVTNKSTSENGVSYSVLAVSYAMQE
jgi:hypothetical protein